MRKQLLIALLAFAPVTNAADKFCRSGASGANDGSDWADAYTDCCRDWGSEGSFTPGTDFVYIDDDHDQDLAQECYLDGTLGEGTNDPVRIVSVVGGVSGTTPGAYSPGATIRTNGGTFDIEIGEKLAIFGVNFLSDDDIFLAGPSGPDAKILCEDCRLELVGATSTNRLDIGNPSFAGQEVVLRNTNIAFGNTLQGISWNPVVFYMYGGTIEDDNQGVFIDDLSAEGGIQAEFHGVDMSAMDGDLVNAAHFTAGSFRFLFNRVTLHASVSIVDQVPDIPGHIVEAYYSQVGTDADPALQMERWTYEGSVTLEETRDRDNGASDGTNQYSWSMDTSVGSNTIEIYEPLRSPPVSFWLDGDASTTQTVRWYVASGATLQDDEFWIDCIFQTSAATSSLGELVTTRPDPLATPANLTTDGSSTWNCSSDCTTAQRIDISSVPDKPGLAQCWANLAKPSERVSFDPFPDIQ